MTISRQCGTGIDQIGPALVQYLSEVGGSEDPVWTLFDQSLIGKVIEHHQLSSSVESYLVENAKFPADESVQAILNLRQSQWSLFNYSADTVRNLCYLGHVVVVGRAGNFVTSDLSNTFHARLVGSLERRTAHISELYDIPTSRARELIEVTDRGRKMLIRRYTNADIEDPKFYHIVVNTDDFSVDGAVRLLADSLLDWAHEKESIMGGS